MRDGFGGEDFPSGETEEQLAGVVQYQDFGHQDEVRSHHGPERLPTPQISGRYADAMFQAHSQIIRARENSRSRSATSTKRTNTQGESR